jgi:hypothetical protein
MLKLGLKEKMILDELLRASPKRVANKLGVPVQKVYSTKNYFLRKVQNGQEFLAVAKSTYKPLLKRRLKTPRIMPEEPETDEWDEDWEDLSEKPIPAARLKRKPDMYL